MNNQVPLISIITVSFNSSKTICQTIESVLNQTYTNIEYIIIDGASSDNTVQIIQEYTDKFALKNINYQYISETDKGIYDAINKGILLASGKWINIQGSDDWLELDACAKIAQVINQNLDVELIYGISRFMDGNKVVGVHQSGVEGLNDFNINHQAVFLNSNLHKKYGLYSLQYKLYSDWDLMLKLRDKIKFYRLEEIIVNFSVNGASKTSYSDFEILKLKLHHKIISKSQYNMRRAFNLLKKWLKH